MNNKIILLFLLGTTFSGFGQEAIVTKLEILGLKRTKESFVRRLVKVKPGSVYDSLKVVTDIRRLNRLAGVAKATHRLTKQTDSDYMLTYTIEENFTIIPGVRISTANNGEFAFRTSIFEFNGFGSNQVYGGFYSRDVFDSYGVFWEAPYLFTNKFGFGINYQNNVSLEPVFFDLGTIDYRFDSKAFEAKFLYEFDFYNNAEIGVRFSNEEYLFDDGTLDPIFPNTVEADKLTFFGEYEYNDLTIDYQYFTGLRSLTNVQFATGGDAPLDDFFIGRTDIEYFSRIGEKGNWASRLRLAYASNNDSEFAPFALDNQLNIRGVGNTIDRGTAAIVLNTEYRQTLYEKGWFVLQGNAFIDAGSWRNPGGEVDELFDGSTIRFSPGVGIRFIHKRIFNAVFRLDYGVGIGDQATNGIVFGIGQYF
jgi:outer membrane protein assembly factor BamA